MRGDAASFVGNIPEHYDSGLGPMVFVDYAADIARRAAACSPAWKFHGIPSLKWRRRDAFIPP